MWFRFTAPQAETYVLNTAGSHYETTLAIYSGSPGTLSLVECSAYFGGEMRGRVLLQAPAGASYYVMVAATDPSPGGTLLLTVERSVVPPLEVTLEVDEGLGLLGNGEVEMSGRVTCSRPAEVGLDGAVQQDETYSYFFPEPFACGPEPTAFRSPTRERSGPAFVPGPAGVLLIAYGYDEHDRDVPEVEMVGQVGSGRLVFARSVADVDEPEATEIFVMNGDGAGVTRLTSNAREDNFPALSPDGRHVAFSRFSKGQFDLFVMSSDGNGLRRLSRTPNDEVLPTWSPDGNRLAYTGTFTTRDGWQSDIFKMRLWDRTTKRLTDTPRTKEFAPEWSPDGMLIAFTRQNERRHRYGIATIGRNGLGLARLVINPLSRHGYTDVNPTWSPDSQWVAFARDHGDDPYVDIFKVRRDGSDLRAVTELFELAENPAWGPDGHIVFQHNEGIAIVRGDGGTITHLTETRTGIPFQWPDW